MTGYARLRKMLPAGELTVTVKSVNHRSLDMHFHLPEDIDFVEPSMRAVLRERLTRGHIDIRASFARVEHAMFPRVTGFRRPGASERAPARRGTAAL